MKRNVLVQILAVVLHFPILAYAGGMDSQGREIYRDGEIIVKFKDNYARSREDMTALYERLHVVSVKRFAGNYKNFEHLLFNKGIQVIDAVEEAKRDPAVEYAQPNYMIYALPVHEETTQRDTCMVPGINYPPGCTNPGNNHGTPCLVPGIPLPPGCQDSGSSAVAPPAGNSQRPQIQPLPAEPASAQDPNLDKVYGLTKIFAPNAWAIERGSKDVIVAVIDTGIDYNHPDLAFNIWRNPNSREYTATGIDRAGEKITGDIVGWDFIHNDNLPFDDMMHGTHCAGTIGAVGNDGRGISGVAQRVSLMAVKFLSAEGSGDTVDAIKAIDYSISRGARILSNSWGAKGDDGNNYALEDAIKRAEAKGVLFVAAAGNDGTDNDSDPAYPASFQVSNIIAVAATNERDQMSFFSNYGVKSVHVGAPGSGIYSTIPNGNYTKLSGTSMAAPHVSGAAALVWSHFPNASYAEIKRRLLTYGDDNATLRGKTVTGKRINVLRALQGQ